MTSKQRAYLKSLAMTMDPIFQIGKASLTPEVIEGIREAIDKRELIKVSVLKNCFDDPREIAEVLTRKHIQHETFTGSKKLTTKSLNESIVV